MFLHSLSTNKINLYNSNLVKRRINITLKMKYLYIAVIKIAATGTFGG